MQSVVLTVLVGTLTLLATLVREHHLANAHRASLLAILLSLVFGLLVYALRAATASAAAMGAVVCLALTESSAQTVNPLLSPGLLALIALFVLTFAATRFGRAAKERRGLAEPKHGRRIAQVLANLGIAALFATTGHLVGALAALAEATADTLSSEVGQALGGSTWLITTRRPVPPGTDGALSLSGTVAGTAGALVLALLSAAALGRLAAAAVIFSAALFGVLCDSLLGATLERRGLLGNDFVNLLSTLAAALAATLLAPHGV